MNLYFDHNATTPLHPEVFAAMEPFLRQHFANPSSSSQGARLVQRAITQAREQVAALIGSDPQEIVFTSGATESNATAIHSARELFPERKQIITSSVEHDAIREPLRWLETQHGYEITRLAVDADGQLDLNELKASIRPNQTALVTLMTANNETGVRFPINECSNLVAEQGVLFHTDAVQAAGKIPLHLKDSPIHLASFSGHKLHGPKGIGALYVNPKVAFRPLFRGGGQEHQRRAGTENVAGIVGLGKAAELAHQALYETPDYVLTLRNDFEQLLRENLPNVIFHGARAERLPNTSHFSIPGTHAEGMLILMDMQGIQLSAGSACHTGALEASHVLTAMGISPPEARESLRVSFAREHRAADVAFLLQALTKAAQKMRGILQS